VTDLDALQHGLNAQASRMCNGGARVAALQRLSGGASQQTWTFVVHDDGSGEWPMVLRGASEGAAERALGDASRPAAEAIEALIKGPGPPAPIGPPGLERSRLPVLADKGVASPWVRTNRRKIDRVEQLLEILEATW